MTSIKIDPYLNIDAGLMSPYEHGETFVLDDGGETDLDLGNYERFLDLSLTRDHNITTGKVYAKVLAKGCTCLANLVCGADASGRAASAEAVVRAGAIPRICEVVRAHSHAPSVVQSGCVALHNLAGLGYAAACRDAGAVTLVEAARRDWPGAGVEMLWAALQS